MRSVRAVCLVALVAYACGSDDDDDGGNCQGRCETKMTSCMLSEEDARSYCEGTCPDLSSSEQDCYDKQSCTAITDGTAADACEEDEGDETCPMLSGCSCGVSGVVQINGKCARSCDEACAALPSGG